MGNNRIRMKVINIIMVFSMILAILGAPTVPATAVSDPSEGNIDDVPSTTPADLGDLDLTELLYGDPAEGVALIQPPEANVEGSASLAHPLPVPPGRAGVQPDLDLLYDSTAGSGWVGTGWDLSVGEVTVDTTYGAPRYLTGYESETYVLDGDRLFPNAIRTTLETRQSGPKADFVRQLEDDNDLIIRHGDSPDDYCWQVVDTEGNQRWYGGVPDGNGGCDRGDESAVLTAEPTGLSGGGRGDFHWALAYVEDISGNTMRLFYDKDTSVSFGQQVESAFGASLYLEAIEYTGFAYPGPDTTAVDRPAYRVEFKRQSGRPDVLVDASSGLPVITDDLLSTVEVYYLSPAHYDSGAAAQLIKGWSLEYETGPYDKSLLTRVGQFGSDGAGNEYAWHEFTWYDEVTDGSGTYDGFAPVEEWGTGDDDGKVNIAAESALGTSWRAGADGSLYVGFNPIIPSKIGSFGGSFTIAGGQSNETSTLVDLDGDSLPDKVWVSGGTVYYRPNLARPGGSRHSDGSWFGPMATITGVDGLGRSSDLNIGIQFEAYPVVAIQVGGGFGFSFGDEYFTDVNGDGRVDFIQSGTSGGHTVYYNVLDGGIPKFIDSSLANELMDKLEVPLDDLVSTLATSEIEEVSELLVNTSPRIDTVRRWIAPFTGTIRIDGDVSFTSNEYGGDGAQATIEHNGSAEWTAQLDASNDADGTPASHDGTQFDVTAGDEVFFRLHVIDNAFADEVSWAPVITYTSPASADVDANNRSQIVYSAADDFTLFGRTGARTAFTEDENIDVTVELETTAALSDDIRAIVVHGRGDSVQSETTVVTVPQLTVNSGSPASGFVTLDIEPPSVPSGEDYEENDWVEVHVVSDSPVDPTAFNVNITTTATGIDDPDLSEIDPDAEVEIPLDVPMVPNVRVFARTDRTSPYAPVTSPNKDTISDKQSTITIKVEGYIQDDENYDLSTDAVLTVKTIDDAVVASKAFTVNDDGLFGLTLLSAEEELKFTPEKNTDYYIEVSIHDPIIGDALSLVKSDVEWKWTEVEKDKDDKDVVVTKTDTDPNVGQMHWPDIDGVFPSGNRGWAYAGYNADHPDHLANGAAADPIDSDLFAFSAAEGNDEETEVPDAGSLDPDAASSTRDGIGDNFESALPYIPWAETGADVADRWRAAEKETLNGRQTVMQSARLGSDTPLEGGSASGREAPQLLSIDGDFHFMLGLVASFTAAAGGGRSLKDYEDYNGDGYADIRSGSEIEYTGPRGALAGTNDDADNPFDTALALGGGIGGSAISVSSEGNASANGDGGQVGDVTVEETSSKPSRGMNIGLGFDISSQWTNPLAGSEAYTEIDDGNADNPDIEQDLEDDDTRDATPAAGASGAIMDRAFFDVNGDGLPDRVDTYTSGEMWVSLNLGYRFSDSAVQWSTGRTQADKDVSGSLSVGFELNAYEFAGGVGYNEGIGYTLFDWMDIDGDGVVDRMDNRGNSQPGTVFGSGDGMEASRAEITYDTSYPNGSVSLDATSDGMTFADLPPGQIQVSRNTGLTGGFDFTFYIGPICLVACYVVINPGVHGGYGRTTAQIQMEDMNGDGALDAVFSSGYEEIQVRLNNKGRTNLLQAVTNPLGGQLRLEYERDGNTIENPESLWVMSAVEVDDGRAGDGADVMRSEFAYEGNVYDPLLRELLGYSSIREEQLDGNGTTVLRSVERDYLNGSPFETGTLTEERTYAGAGSSATVPNPVQATTFSWGFVNADPQSTDFNNQVVVSSLPAVGKTARTSLFDMALSPRLLTEQLTQWDDEGDTQTVITQYTYNEIGDVLTVHDLNEDEIPEDDTFTAMTYSACATRSGSRILGADETWVSVPQTVTVYGNDEASGEILKYRHGGPDLCVNAASVRIAELVDLDDGNGCGPLYAITELGFDDYGSFNSVAWPTNAAPSSCADYPPATVASADLTFDGCSSLSAADDANRLCVDYVFDDHRFTAIGQVTDNHGISSSATYDPSTGRLASRTDESGNVTTYTYDAQGRLATITAPREQGSGTPTLSYGYGGLDATFNPNGAHTWSTAHHYDQFNAGNTIDTVAFVDGMGRVVQRKADAAVDGVTGEARIVEGAVEYDALGREVKEWYPVVETDSDFAQTAYNTWNSETPTATTHVPETVPILREFTTLDSLKKQTLPDGSEEEIAYDFDILPPAGGVYSAPITMSRVQTTDPLDKLTIRYLDVGGAVFLRIESPIGANDPDGGNSPLDALPGGDVLEPPRIVASTATPGDITTAYEYDRLGRLTAVIDTAGIRTEHTYDRFDAVTSTNTPDAGLVQRTYAPSGRLLTEQRAVGTVATYSLDRDRIVAVDYSDDTPSVTYEYGADGAAENAAGRVTRAVDGSMERTYGYDVDGNVSRETADMDDDPFGTGFNPDPPVWTTQWQYDSLGRVAVLTYPSGEDLAYDYDFGGRPSHLESQAPQHDLYDQYGNAVPRPDTTIVYIDEIRYDQFGEATYMRTGTGVETHYDREPTRRFLAGIQTDSTAIQQYEGTMSTARPLQRLEYTYDAVGNVRDVLNGLYADGTETVITEMGPAPENNVPGPSYHAFTYDGHYRLTGGVGTFIDQKENRDFSYNTDYAPNGNLMEKRQVTTTTSTTSNGGKKERPCKGKKCDEGGTGDDTTTERTCESDTGSGGGSFNQDTETTYVIAAGDLAYAPGTHQLIRSGNRTYTYDANGNMTGWVQPCANGKADISRTFEWDAENRLTRIAEDNNDTDYRYNAEGARTLERGPGGLRWFVNEHWRTFNDGHYYASIFVGEQLVASHRTSPQDPPPPACTDTLDNPCTCEANDACVVTDISQCDLTTGIFDPATSTCQPKESRTIHFLHKDLQGSMRVATDEVGKVFQYMDYLPNGRPWIAGQSTTKDTPYLFAGGWTDMTYDLVNFGQRWYEPREENFISPEPLLEENPYAVVDDPSLLAAYTYASSNPLKYVDPSGQVSTAANGFVLIDDKGEHKHQKGNITISLNQRANRKEPAITFGGRYSNDADGQKLVEAFKDFDDAVSRYTTILSISIEDGVRKIRVFGVTVDKTPAPDPDPGQTGADTGNDPLRQAEPAGAPPNPGQQADINNGPANPADAGGAADGPGDAGAAAPPPDAGGDGQDAPTSAQPPPPDPAPAAPGAVGPDLP